MNKKMIFTIGIPAYNEEKNISNLIDDIENQKYDGFLLRHIYIVSDLSSDNTDLIVSNIKNKKIRLIKNKKRIGKTGSVLNLIKLTKKDNVDILVLIDADLKLNNEYTLQNLLLPFKNNAKLITCGDVIPNTPSSFIEKLVFFGERIWSEILKNNDLDKLYYKTNDQLIALGIKELDFEYFKNKRYIHDQFYFLTCMKNKIKFKFVRNSKAFYHLPRNYSDYKSQMLRFLSTEIALEKNFSKKFIEKYSTIDYRDKLKAFIKIFPSQPLIAFSYFLIQTQIKLIHKFRRKQIDNIWDTIISTKNDTYFNKLDIKNILIAKILTFFEILSPKKKKRSMVLANYTYIKTLKKPNSILAPSVSLYKSDKGEFVVVKNLTYNYRHIGYIHLLNEAYNLKLLNMLSFKKSKIHFPKLIKTVNERGNLMILTSFDEARLLTELPFKTQLNVINECLNYFCNLQNSKLFNKSEFSIITKQRIFITYFYYFFMALVKDLKNINLYLKLLYYFSLKVTKNSEDYYEICHRDLSLNNVLYSYKNIMLLDPDMLVVSIKNTDLAILSQNLLKQFGDEMLLKFLSTRLKNRSDLNSFIYLSIFYSFQTLTVEKRNNNFYKEAKKYLEFIHNRIISIHQINNNFQVILSK